MLHAQSQAPTATTSQRLLIGTSGKSSRGILATTFSPQTGTLAEPQVIAEVTNPSFLAVRPGSSPTLFAVSETDDVGAVYGFQLGNDSASPFKPINHVTTQGSAATHLSAQGAAVVVANYGGGSVASFAIDAQGQISPASLIAFPPTGHGPVPDRQEKSHAHCATFTPDGNHVLVNDLGLDCIHIFRLDKHAGKLTPNTIAQWKAAPGSGPRHLAYHPNGRWVYNINELSSTIDQLEWHATEGTLTAKSRVSTVPAGVPPADARACEVVLSKDHHFLYASTRIYENFAVFSVDPQTGALTLVQHLPNPGKESRHIAIDPTGHFFLSANQFSDDISIFPIDTTTGKLSQRTSTLHVGAPSCLLFT